MAQKTCMQLVRESYATAIQAARQESRHNKWSNCTQHIIAWQSPRPVERAVKNMIVGLAEYCDAYTQGNPEEHGCLGDDGYWFEHAADMVSALIVLLSMNTGRLDGGTLSRLIHAIAKNAHIELEE